MRTTFPRKASSNSWPAAPQTLTTLYVDEFGELLEKLTHAKHMAGLKGLLLTVYGGDNYTYRRHSKRMKGGDRVDDADDVTDPHLNILGATTPAIFEKLTAQDVRSGLLTRFAMIMPSTKPARRVHLRRRRIGRQQ